MREYKRTVCVLGQVEVDEFYTTLWTWVRQLRRLMSRALLPS